MRQAAVPVNGRDRSGPGTSWLAGLVPGVGGGFLMLEFPVLGLAICVAAAVVIWRMGRAIAGGGGLFVGIGGAWLALFGQVAMRCRDESGCTAPDIGSAVAASGGVLAIGMVISILAVIRTRRT